MVAKKIVVAIRESGQKEVLSIPPLSSIAVPQQEPQVKVKVEVPKKDIEEMMSTRSTSSTVRKRFKESATRLGKRHKTLVQPIPRKIVEVKDDVTTEKKAWKPKVEKLNEQIIENGDFARMNKYYDLYDYTDRLNLEDAVVKHDLDW